QQHSFDQQQENRASFETRGLHWSGSLSPWERVRVRVRRLVEGRINILFFRTSFAPHPGPLPKGEGEKSRHHTFIYIDHVEFMLIRGGIRFFAHPGEWLIALL